jgi:hypothetical protein
MAGTSGSVSTGALDREFEILRDDNGPFIRHLFYVGDQIIPKDTDVNGSTYTPSGAVRSCGA